MDFLIPKSFKVQSSEGQYDVIFNNNLDFSNIEYKKVCLVCDKKIIPYINKDNLPLIEIEATENNKNLLQIPEIIMHLKKIGVNRDYTIIAIGGGIIQDIVCFIASIYMRGLSWVYYPTTLLGMADSCIGGKSSINVGEIKNLVGTFHPPQTVFINKNFINTLSKEQKIGGLLEAIKIIFASGNDNIYEICQMSVECCKNENDTNIINIIYTSLLAKKSIIEIDEFDKHERLLLNFGHTFGHAVESVSNYEISHGIAVGIGMICAMFAMEEILNQKLILKRMDTLKQTVLFMLSQIENLKQNLKNINCKKLITVFKSDKKHSSENYYCILFDENGFLKRTYISKNYDQKITNTFLKTIQFLIDYEI